MNRFSMSFCIRPQLFAVAAVLGATQEWDLPSEVLLDAELRMTAFYRPESTAGGGGFLLRVRIDPLSVPVSTPFLHLAVVEQGCTGETMVFEWVAPWAPVPPTTEWPENAVEKIFNEDGVGLIVRHIDERLREFLMRQYAAAHGKIKAVNGFTIVDRGAKYDQARFRAVNERAFMDFARAIDALRWTCQTHHFQGEG